MFKCSVQEGWQNRNRLALGICFGQPRRAHHPLRGASVDQPERKQREVCFNKSMHAEIYFAAIESQSFGAIAAYLNKTMHT